MLLFVVHASSMASEKSYPVVQKGVIDLSAWDFKHSGFVELNGLWEFYWGRHIPPALFKNNKTIEVHDFLHVPDSWCYQSYRGQKLPFTGYATYRVVARLNERSADSALWIKDVGSAYTLFINGIKVHSCGFAGETRERTVPQQLPALIPLPITGQEIEIVFWVSNFSQKNGGVFYPIIIGDRSELSGMHERRRALEIFLLGVLLIMVMYHMSFFIVRRKDKTPLLFALFCLVIFVRAAFTGERYALSLFSAIPFSVVLSIEFLSLPLGLITFSFFVYYLYPDEYSKAGLRIVKWMTLFQAAFIVLMPSIIYTHALIPFQIIVLSVSIYILYVCIKALREKRTGAVIFFIGGVVLFFSVVNDILYADYIIHTQYLLPIGMIVFIFSQAYIISKRFTIVLMTVEKMTEDLLLVNKRLQKEIEDRISAEKENEEMRKKLETSLTKVIGGFIPICAKCKKIRNKNGTWEQIENYIGTHSNAVFSHGLCPDCIEELYPGMYNGKNE